MDESVAVLAVFALMASAAHDGSDVLARLTSWPHLVAYACLMVIVLLIARARRRQ